MLFLPCKPVYIVYYILNIPVAIVNGLAVNIAVYACAAPPQKGAAQLRYIIHIYPRCAKGSPGFMPSALPPRKARADGVAHGGGAARS